jgi:hypothetical protein
MSNLARRLSIVEQLLNAIPNPDTYVVANMGDLARLISLTEEGQRPATVTYTPEMQAALDRVARSPESEGCPE